MNRYATLADLRLRIPGAASLPTGDYPGTMVAWSQAQWDAVSQAALDDAETLIDVGVFDLKTLAAHVQLAAHVLALSYPTSALAVSVGGAVASLSAGEISASFVTPAAASTDDTSMSSYGRAYERILGSVMHVPTAVH